MYVKKGGGAGGIGFKRVTAIEAFEAKKLLLLLIDSDYGCDPLGTLYLRAANIGVTGTTWMYEFSEETLAGSSSPIIGRILETISEPFYLDITIEVFSSDRTEEKCVITGVAFTATGIDSGEQTDIFVYRDGEIKAIAEWLTAEFYIESN